MHKVKVMYDPVFETYTVYKRRYWLFWQEDQDFYANDFAGSNANILARYAAIARAEYLFLLTQPTEEVYSK